MATLLDYLKGAVKEYGPGIADAAASEVAERVQKFDAHLRNPKRIRRVVGGLIDGFFGAWNTCPHGIESGEPCAKCKPELKP